MQPDRRMYICTSSLFLAATLLASASPASSQDIVMEAEFAACRQKYSAAGITAAPNTIRTTLDNSLDARTLTALEKKAADQRVLGRTVARLRNTTRFQMQHTRFPSGRICTRPSMTVELSYDPVTIFVASEYLPGSCEYRKILEHEHRHVAVHQLHLAALAPLVQADLRDFFAGTNLMHDNTTQAREFVQKSAQDTIRTRIALMAEEARARQLEVDSTEEISRLSRLRRLCANEATEPPGGQ